MMNSIILNRVILRTFRHDFSRYLSVQSNVINKSNSSNETLNFHRKFENRSTNFPLFRQPFRNSLCSAPLPLCRSFHRNLTRNSEDPLDLDNPRELFNPEKEKTIEEELQETFSFITDTADYLSETMVVKYAADLFVEIHNFTGLPWWASIALTAFFVRTTIVLPCSISQIQIMGKLQMVKAHMKKVEEKLKMESDEARRKHGWPKHVTETKLKKEIKHQREMHWAKENCHPGKTAFLVMVQVPTWIIFSTGLRTLTLPPKDGVAASNVYTELSTGGFDWVTDLTAVDHLALPATLGVIYFLTIEVHRLFRLESHAASEQLKWSLMQYLNLLLVGLSSSSSAALNIYWISSASYGLIQAFLLNTQTSYRLLNIPVLGSPLEHPYRHFGENLRNRFKKKKKESIIIIEK